MTPPRIWTIVAARSGSKGLPDKNIRPLAGVPLLGHAVRFALSSNLFEKVMVSTDSDKYAEIGRSYGAWVPFLRGEAASADDSMEEHVLADIDRNLRNNNIDPPDMIVWLRPTFPFRSKEDLETAIQLMDSDTESVRLVTEGEPRLYEPVDGYLVPRFDDGGRSMVRRQEFPSVFRVFHTDIFWYDNIRKGEMFLGKKVRYVPVHKLCSMDVDGIEDFEIIEAIMKSRPDFARKYMGDQLSAS